VKDKTKKKKCINVRCPTWLFSRLLAEPVIYVTMFCDRLTCSDDSDVTDFEVELLSTGVGLTQVEYNNVLNITPLHMGLHIYDITAADGVSA